MAVDTAAFSEQTDEQRAIIEMVRQFADEQILPNAEHYDHEDSFPEPIVEQMKELGLFGVTIPEEYGGMGLDLTTYAMIVEELSRGWISISGIVNTHFIGSYLLMKFGTEEQQRKYLPNILSVDFIFCQGYSEPNAGSDLASLQTRAERDGDSGDFVVNGSKIWTSLAQDATHMFLLARTDQDAKRQAGISFFILDFKTPGVTVRPIRNITGHEDFCQVFFDNVRIPAENIVGGLNNGWTVAKGLLGFERLNSGSPRRPQYPMLKTRELAQARGLWDDPEFRSKYTKLELDVDDLALLFQRYADVIAAGGAPGADMSMLKIWSSETTMRMNGLMLEAAGSASCMAGDVAFGDARVDILGSYYIVFPATIAAGSNDIQRNILAKRVLGLP
jgi:alkylation response protein AidB-like acyl-CoA dehydrogenase